MREVESKYLLTKEQYEQLCDDLQFIGQTFITNYYYVTNSADMIRIREQTDVEELWLTYKRKVKQEDSVVDSIEVNEVWTRDVIPEYITYEELPRVVQEHTKRLPGYWRKGFLNVQRKHYDIYELNLEVELDRIELDPGVIVCELEMESFSSYNHKRLRDFLQSRYDITEVSNKSKYQRYKEHLEKEE